MPTPIRLNVNVPPTVEGGVVPQNEIEMTVERVRTVDSTDAVRFTEQTLTAAQQAQARTNISAASASDVAGKYTKPSGGIPATDIADGVIPDVSTKVDLNDFNTLAHYVDVMGETVDGKADQSDLDALSDTVDEKADQSDVDALSANITDLKGVLDAVATVADVSLYVSGIATTTARTVQLADFGLVAGETYRYEIGSYAGAGTVTRVLIACRDAQNTTLETVDNLVIGDVGDITLPVNTTNLRITAWVENETDESSNKKLSIFITRLSNDDKIDELNEQVESLGNNVNGINAKLSQIGYFADNLFVRGDSNVIRASISANTGAINSNTSCRSVFVECEPNTEYYVTKTPGGRFAVGTTTSIPAVGSLCADCVRDDTASRIKYTTNANAAYLVAFVYYATTDSVTADEMLDSVEITIGETTAIDREARAGTTKTVTVSGTTPSITATANTRYLCGECATLSITPPASGLCEVRFTSGTTPTVLTLPNTVKMPSWWNGVEASKTYDLMISDGVYGAVMAWS